MSKLTCRNNGCFWLAVLSLVVNAALLVIVITLLLIILSLVRQEDAVFKPITSSRDDPNGPYYQQIYTATSPDGLTWTKSGEQAFDHSSVPGAIIKDEVIYVYMVDAGNEEDQITVAISEDFGETYTSKRVEIKGVPHYDPVDPHPILIDGKIHLFYLGNFSRLIQTNRFTIYSASSEDGVMFDNVQELYSFDEMTTDPDVFFTENDLRMLLTSERGMRLLVSDDNGETFTEDASFRWQGGGVSDTIQINDQYYTHFCDNGISRATGADTSEFGDVERQVISQGIGDTIICDPSIIQLPDQSYLMYYKSQELKKLGPPM